MPATEKLVRQAVVFPPVGSILRSMGLARHRHLLLELEAGAVFHVRVPSNWNPLHDAVTVVAEAIGHFDFASMDTSQLASMVSWEIETQIEFLGIDLSKPDTGMWPVRAAAIERHLSEKPASEISARIAERARVTEAELANGLKAELMAFVGRLDGSVVSLSSLWNSMPWARYNWFASSKDPVRRYRIQLAQVFPALVPILTGELGVPEPFARSLADVVDSGKPLIDALVSTCQIRSATARHVLTMPPSLMEGTRLKPLIRSLDALSPDRFPRELSEWLVFGRVVGDLVPGITSRPMSSPLNLAFVPEVCKHGWMHAERQLRRLCIDEQDAILVREFWGLYRNALMWNLLENGLCTEDTAIATCAALIDQEMASAGLARMFEVSRALPALLRLARSELANEHDLWRGKCWHSVLDKSIVLEDCEIEPLLTVVDLERTGAELHNCIDGRFAFYCANGTAHIFSIRDASGGRLGALHLRFNANRKDKFAIHVVDCKGPSNAKISSKGMRAVSAFCAWLRDEEAQQRLLELRRLALAWRLPKNKDVEKRIEMETAILALRRLNQGSLRFDILRDKLLACLRPTSMEKVDGSQQCH